MQCHESIEFCYLRHPWDILPRLQRSAEVSTDGESTSLQDPFMYPVVSRGNGEWRGVGRPGPRTLATRHIKMLFPP